MRNQNTKELVLTALFAAIIIIMAFTPLGYIPLVVINATIIHIPVILGALFCGPKKGAFLGFIFGLTSFIKNTITPATLSAFVFSPVIAANLVGVSGIFKSAFICFVPRILVGVVPYFVYVGVKKAVSSEQRKLWATVLNLLIGLFLFIGLRAFLLRLFTENPLPAALVLGVSLAVGVAVCVSLELYTIKKSSNASAFIYAGVLGAMTNTILVMGSILVLYKNDYASALSIDPAAVLGTIAGVISFNGVVEAIVASIIVTALGLALGRLAPVKMVSQHRVGAEG